MTAPHRLFLLVLLALLGAALPLVGSLGQEETPDRATPGLVLVSTIKGAISPATAKQIADAIALAEEREAELLVIRLDTPGGLVTSTRDIITAILGSKVPVAGYVWPAGGHAASAGTFIIYATSIAAMAPGTNIGAATPVMMSGSTTPTPQQPPRPADEDGARSTPSNEEALSKKATNDAVALIRSLAATHGRNADWAEEAVREGESLSAQDALEKNVVEVLASDLDALLREINGRTVITGAGERTLNTTDAEIEYVEPSFLVEMLALIANPNVAFLLMMVGVYGIIFELSNPGSIGPGILGAISLLLGLYALNQLPLDYAGVALIILGLVLMGVEVFTPTFGMAGFGGLVAFVLGAAMLVDSNNPEFRLSWWTIVGTAIASAAFIFVLIGYTLRAMKRPVLTGIEEMIGAEARVLDWADGNGFVHVRGERWRATGPVELAPQSTVHIERVDGLTLIVR